jgi:hypothetical protein
MSNLKSLTFTTLPAKLHDPKLIRRQRLIDRLEEQRKLAKDPTLVSVHKRWVKAEDGSNTLVEVQRRVKPWWRTDHNGNIALTVRAGLKTLEFEKGKVGIAVGSVDRLDTVFVTLTAAVRAGELDGLLQAAMGAGGREIPKPKKG